MEELRIKTKMEEAAEVYSLVETVRSSGPQDLIQIVENVRDYHHQMVLKIETAERYLKDIKATAFLARLGDHSTQDLNEILRKIEVMAIKAIDIFTTEPDVE